MTDYDDLKDRDDVLEQLCGILADAQYDHHSIYETAIEILEYMKRTHD